MNVDIARFSFGFVLFDSDVEERFELVFTELIAPFGHQNGNGTQQLFAAGQSRSNPEQHIAVNPPED